MAPGESFSDKVKKSPKVAIYWGKLALQKMPPPVQRKLTSRRHLTIVTDQIALHTDPGYLQPRYGLTDTISDTVPIKWLVPTRSTPFPQYGLEPGNFTEKDRESVTCWLENNYLDSDQDLVERLDAMSDEYGRFRSTLRSRLNLNRTPPTNNTQQPQTGRVLLDARCLQAPQYATRGIGKYGYELLDTLRTAVGDRYITLLIDRDLTDLDPKIQGDCEITHQVTKEQTHRFGIFFQPSPMTASQDPLMAILHSNVYKVSMFHDFIPMHFPKVYLTDATTRVEYSTAFDSLAYFNEFYCNSINTKNELETRLKKRLGPTLNKKFQVVWPEPISDPTDNVQSRSTPDGPIVVMTGDEPRKNNLGTLAAIGLATTNDPQRNVIVVGMANQWVSVHNTSILAAMRPGEVSTSQRISDQELIELLVSASVTVVASFDEGLSLPVIEAVRAGSPVAGSSIPEHEELLGNNGVLVPAANIKELAKAINQARGNRALHAKQLKHLNTHRHVSTPQATINTLQSFTPELSDQPNQSATTTNKRPKIAFATPWPPQQSGIADFSLATATELAKISELTLFTTSGAQTQGFTSRNVRELIDTPETGNEFDHIISVLGNSSFHLPFFDLLNYQDATVISHDTRFIEYYAAVTGGGVEQLMLKTREANPRGRIEPPLNQQIDDMRLVQNMGFWEVSRKAKQIILHTPMAVPIISEQVGYTPNVLPFANYRAPKKEWLTEQARSQARTNLGFGSHPKGTIHLASFGFVDNRTKMADVLMEAAAWLTQWGHQVALYFVGSAQPDVAAELTIRARQLDLVDFAITGYTAEENYRDYLRAIDLGVQLRISPYLGVAGPLSDMAAFGTSAIGSRGVCIDVDTPDFIDQLPDDVSSVMVAQRIEYRMSNPQDPTAIETQRKDYLERKSPQRYSHELLKMLEKSDRQGMVVR